MNHLSIFFADLRCIFLRRRGIKKPFRLFLTHLRLKFKQKYCEAFRIKKTEEKILGLRLTFPDYGWFCHLWREIFVREYYYFESKAASPFILDVGSNIGMSICYFKALYPAAKIVGFEPDPRAFAWLKKNMELNGFDGVVVHNIALASKNGRVSFYQDAAVEASGINSTKPGIIAGPKSAIEVGAGKLSGFISGGVDLLKIDAEGAEYDILKEAKGKLASVRNIFLEIHQTEGCLNEPLPRLLKILDDGGFRYAITGTFISHHEFMASPAKSYAAIIDATRR